MSKFTLLFFCLIYLVVPMCSGATNGIAECYQDAYCIFRGHQEHDGEEECIHYVSEERLQQFHNSAHKQLTFPVVIAGDEYRILYDHRPFRPPVYVGFLNEFGGAVKMLDTPNIHCVFTSGAGDEVKYIGSIEPSNSEEYGVGDFYWGTPVYDEAFSYEIIETNFGIYSYVIDYMTTFGAPLDPDCEVKTALPPFNLTFRYICYKVVINYENHSLVNYVIKATGQSSLEYPPPPFVTDLDMGVKCMYHPQYDETWSIKLTNPSFGEFKAFPAHFQLPYEFYYQE